MSRKRLFPVVVLLMGSVVILTGCNNSPSDSDNPEHKAMLGMTEDQKRQKQIDDIKNNPKMPEAAKQMAIANMSRNNHP